MLIAALIGLAMVVLTTVIQALFMVASARFLRTYRSRHGLARSYPNKALLVSGLTAWMFIAALVEGLAWALLYRYHSALTVLPDLETAFYFSMATFTTVGYGDIVLEGSWRMLASLQAANGMIIFGWTTALLFHFIQRIYERDEA